MISVESVHTTGRGGRTALNDITMELRPGSATAVIGEGATTVLGLFNRLVEPSAGRITWDDKSLRQYRKGALRRAVGWWSGPGGLFAELSVLDNIAAVPRALGWEEPARRTRGFELLEEVGLPRSTAVRSPDELSRPQQVLVTLARALAADPELVLADDPMRDLEPDEASQVAQVARRLQPERGDMWLVATRSVDVAVVLADQLVVLDAGHIEQQGPIAEVVETPATPRVAELVGPHRGARALALQSADALRPVRVATVRDPRSARRGVPTLVVDRNAQPVSWTRGMVAPDGEVATDPLGHSFVPATDTLRDALEAVLTSPTGLGVAVGEHGRYLGVVSAEAIWELDLEHRHAAARLRADQAYREREAERQAAREAAEREAEARAAEAQAAKAREGAGPAPVEDEVSTTPADEPHQVSASDESPGLDETSAPEEPLGETSAPEEPLDETPAPNQAGELNTTEQPGGESGPRDDSSPDRTREP